MESREHLIKLLDKPKARKYRDADLSRLLFDKLETIKPGAIAELSKGLIGPPPGYAFYDSFNLGYRIKLTKSMADEIVKMGIPDSVTVRGDVEPEALLVIINEMAATKRLNKWNKEFKFSLSLASPVEVSKLLKLAESMTMEQQDELADNLNKLDIYMYTSVHKRFDLHPSALKSVKLITKALDVLGSDINERMGSVGSWRSHREWQPSGSIIDRAAWVFTGTDNKVLIEGITAMLSSRIDKMAVYEIEKEFTGAFIPVKIIQIKSAMTADTYANGEPLVVGAPHKSNDRTSSCIYKAMSLIEELKDKMVEVKIWGRMPSPTTTPDGTVEPGYKVVERGVEYATIKIVASLDSTLAKVSAKEMSSMINKCDELIAYSFYPCLPNSGKFHDASVEAPAALDIMELEQVKDPSKMLVSKSIHLNGVDLSNVVGPDNQSKLQQFITACLLGPPTDRKQEMCSTEDYPLQLAGTFVVNNVNHGIKYKTAAIHAASGTDITYENLKPIFKAMESIENLVVWLATADIKDKAITYDSEFVSSKDIYTGVIEILTTKLCISKEVATAIADMCSALPRCGMSFDRRNLELETRAALANYLAHAVCQSGVTISIPASCRVSTRLAMEVKRFSAEREYLEEKPGVLSGRVIDLSRNPAAPRPRIWKVSCSNYFCGPSNQGNNSMYELMSAYGIDDEASTLDEAFALDKDDKLKVAAENTAAAISYAGMPCVGFDKDNNYVFKIKEFAEICTSRMSSTNNSSGGDSSNRATVIATPYDWNKLYTFFINNLNAKSDIINKAATLATVP